MIKTISTAVVTELMFRCFNIQLFADGGGGASAGASAGAGTGEGSTGLAGETTSTSFPADDKGSAPKIVYGKQSESNTEVGAVPEEKPKMTFAELVKSDEWKDDAQKYMDKAFSKRFKEQESLKAENARMRDILNIANVRYGLDSASDSFLDDLSNSIQNDTKLYEDEALEAGLPVEEYVKVKKAERILENNKREQADRERQAFINEHCKNLVSQSDAMREQFPSFDLETEMSNPQFRKLVDPQELGGIGLSVDNAYRVIHYKDILNATVNNAVNQTAINTANAVKANKERPRENGMNHRASVIVKDDPSQFTLDDFKRIKEQFIRTGVAPKF